MTYQSFVGKQRAPTHLFYDQAGAGMRIPVIDSASGLGNFLIH